MIFSQAGYTQTLKKSNLTGSDIGNLFCDRPETQNRKFIFNSAYLSHELS